MLPAAFWCLACCEYTDEISCGTIVGTACRPVIENVAQIAIACGGSLGGGVCGVACCCPPIAVTGGGAALLSVLLLVPLSPTCWIVKGLRGCGCDSVSISMALTGGGGSTTLSTTRLLDVGDTLVVVALKVLVVVVGGGGDAVVERGGSNNEDDGVVGCALAVPESVVVAAVPGA
jgi:hypothetical protein